MLNFGEELSCEEKDNFTIQTDGTSKYGQHFGTYDVATGLGFSTYNNH